MLEFSYCDKSFYIKLYSDNGDSLNIKTSNIQLVQKRKSGKTTKKLTIATFEYKHMMCFLSNINNYNHYYYMDNEEKIFIKNDNNKLLTIYNNPVCVGCGVIATYASLDKYPDSASVHFNFYSMDSCGNISMMTKDHIIPRSLEGPNINNNIQTMCEACNSFKGARLQEFRLDLLDKQIEDLTQAKIVPILSV